MHQPIDRRTLLRASGVSLALPLLESMRPALAASEPEPPQRMVFLCTTLGLHGPNLWPKEAGRDYESTHYLKLLSDHRDDFTLFSGLQHEDQTGRQPHDSEMTWLTAARKPGMGGFRNSISVDQVAATYFGNQTRHRSITLGTLKAQSQSYTSGGVMIPAQTSPANLFAELFLEGKPEEIRKQRQSLDDGRSILDQLAAQRKQLQRRASASDNHLLEDFFASVRDTEVDIAAVQGWMDRPKPKVDAEPPKDIRDNADLIGRARLLLDLVPLIVQTDSSRVISVMIQDHYAVPKVDGVTGNHHNLSHHGLDPTKIAELQRIEEEIISSFAGLLKQMKSMPEAGQRLLDQTSILFGSNLGNANAHEARNLPIFLAGGGFKHGGYVAKSDEPLCNLFVTMLQHAGMETDSFSQATGAMRW
ncbi:MAG: DUF1552 domain-containing protein [Planctomycetota bacterium]